MLRETITGPRAWRADTLDASTNWYHPLPGRVKVDLFAFWSLPLERHRQQRVGSEDHHPRRSRISGSPPPLRVMR